LFDFSGSDYGVHFWNLLANLVAVALDQTACDDQSPRPPELFIFGHLENRLDGLLLCRRDEAAGVDDDHVGLVGARRDLVACALEHAHHHLAIDKVLRASQAYESNFQHGRAFLLRANK